MDHAENGVFWAPSPPMPGVALRGRELTTSNVSGSSSATLAQPMPNRKTTGRPWLSNAILPPEAIHESLFIPARLVELTTGLRPNGPARSAVSLIQLSEWPMANGFGAKLGFWGTPESGR